ncbi:GNAT family N-acetyltransferase [Clostridium sediminicola]|uniref:GNAT family N-acetyltransferase n=1 Tax=Clostridium sediminicola TaxID=3114879 RepID=UPI0031F24A9D
MYNLKRLNNRNIKYFREIYNSSHNLISDFFAIYDDESLIKKYLIRKNVFLLCSNGKYVGYIWIDENNGYYSIIDLYILEKYNNVYTLTVLLKSILNYKNIRFKSEENNLLLQIITEYGFQIKSQVREMEYTMQSKISLPLIDGLYVENFKKGVDEPIRCRLQNEIFNKKDRLPMQIKDIYYDEMQKYYYDKGVFLLTFKGVYIGIGQIIYEGSTPILVNFGVIKEYRKKGFGEYFLKYILNFMKAQKEDIVLLKVSNENNAAKILYKKVGFIEKKVIYTLIRQDD